MKWLAMYAAMLYIVACADDLDDKAHSKAQRLYRAAVWPLTITSWFRTQNVRLHRLLNILWAILIMGWLLSLMADRL